MKKTFNIILNFEYEEELINIIMSFIDQKKNFT